MIFSCNTNVGDTISLSNVNAAASTGASIATSCVDGGAAALLLVLSWKRASQPLVRPLKGALLGAASASASASTAAAAIRSAARYMFGSKRRRISKLSFVVVVFVVVLYKRETEIRIWPTNVSNRAAFSGLLDKPKVYRAKTHSRTCTNTNAEYSSERVVK